jgi:hypothetical protein
MKKILLVVVIGAVVVGGLFATGLLSPKRFWQWTRRFYYQGRSQVHKATDFTVQPVKDVKAAEICRNNLRRIESAKRKVAQQKGMAVGRLTWADLAGELGKHPPKCPSGGEYILGDIGAMPKCTIGSNGTPRPEDDHIAVNW